MKKILLIEDEKILAEMYRDKFREAGLETVLAFSVERGLKLLAKEKPDLIILDILFPRESGIFFLKERNKNPELASVGVVVFSNYDDVETKKEVLELGVKDYLIKTNYTPQQLVEKIKEYLKTEPRFAGKR